MELEILIANAFPALAITHLVRIVKQNSIGTERTENFINARNVIEFFQSSKQDAAVPNAKKEKKTSKK